jgi:glycine/D-amino acid oxidase-like deaminating enzyme
MTITVLPTNTDLTIFTKFDLPPNFFNQFETPDEASAREKLTAEQKTQLDLLIQIHAKLKAAGLAPDDVKSLYNQMRADSKEKINAWVIHKDGSLISYTYMPQLGVVYAGYQLGDEASKQQCLQQIQKDTLEHSAEFTKTATPSLLFLFDPLHQEQMRALANQGAAFLKNLIIAAEDEKGEEINTHNALYALMVGKAKNGVITVSKPEAYTQEQLQKAMNAAVYYLFGHYNKDKVGNRLPFNYANPDETFLNIEKNVQASGNIEVAAAIGTMRTFSIFGAKPLYNYIPATNASPYNVQILKFDTPVTTVDDLKNNALYRRSRAALEAANIELDSDKSFLKQFNSEHNTTDPKDADKIHRWISLTDETGKIVAVTAFTVHLNDGHVTVGFQIGPDQAFDKLEAEIIKESASILRKHHNLDDAPVTIQLQRDPLIDNLSSEEIINMIAGQGRTPERQVQLYASMGYDAVNGPIPLVLDAENAGLNNSGRLMLKKIEVDANGNITRLNPPYDTKAALETQSRFYNDKSITEAINDFNNQAAEAALKGEAEKASKLKETTNAVAGMQAYIDQNSTMEPNTEYSNKLTAPKADIYDKVIVGGGPGGLLTAIAILKEAKIAGRDLKVVLISDTLNSPTKHGSHDVPGIDGYVESYVTNPFWPRGDRAEINRITYEGAQQLKEDVRNANPNAPLSENYQILIPKSRFGLDYAFRWVAQTIMRRAAGYKPTDFHTLPEQDRAKLNGFSNASFSISGAGQLDAPPAMAGLLYEFMTLGGEVREGVRYEGQEIKDNGERIIKTSNGGEIRTKSKPFLSTGSKHMSTLQDLPVEIQSQYTNAIHILLDEADGKTLFPAGPTAIAIPSLTNIVWGGANTEKTPSGNTVYRVTFGFGETNTPDREKLLTDVKEKMQELLPADIWNKYQDQINDPNNVSFGAQSATPNGLPLAGRLQNIDVATGFWGRGLAQYAGFARAYAKWVVNGDDKDLRKFEELNITKRGQPLPIHINEAHHRQYSDKAELKKQPADRGASSKAEPLEQSRATPAAAQRNASRRSTVWRTAAAITCAIGMGIAGYLLGSAQNPQNMGNNHMGANGAVNNSVSVTGHLSEVQLTRLKNVRERLNVSETNRHKQLGEIEKQKTEIAALKKQLKRANAEKKKGAAQQAAKKKKRAATYTQAPYNNLANRPEGTYGTDCMLGRGGPSGCGSS